MIATAFESEMQNRNEHSWIVVCADFETEAVRQRAQREIFRKNIGNDFSQLFVAGDLDQPPQQLSA
jgi:hypothetical protein